MNGSPTGVPVARSHTRTVSVVAAGDDHRAAIQLRRRHRSHRAVVAGELLVGALQLPGCPPGAPWAGQAVCVDAVGEGFGPSASCGEPEVGGVLGGRVAADQRQGAAVGAGGGACGPAGGGVERGEQSGWVRGEQEPGVLGEVVDAAAAGGVGGQVGAGVGVAGGPVAPSAGSAGHVAASAVVMARWSAAWSRPASRSSARERW